MQWPQEIVEAFKQVPFTPREGESKETVVQYLLDQTAKFAVWRAQGDPENLYDAYELPYTPIGHLSMNEFADKVENCTFDGNWCAAVDKLNEFVRQGAARICFEFQAQGEAYPDQIE
jgi:hypothetical protein